MKISTLCRLSLMTLMVSAMTASAAGPVTLQRLQGDSPTSRNLMPQEGKALRLNRLTEGYSSSMVPAMKGVYRNLAINNGTKRAPGAPDSSLSIITEAPEGVSTTYVRTGITMAYSWLGLIIQPSDGSVGDFVVTEDNKVYMNNPFSLVPIDAWLEGVVKNDTYTFTFPQYIEHDEENWGTEEEPDIEVADFYAVVLEYNEEEDWYELTDDQTYEFKVNADGSLTPVNPDLMIGVAQWNDMTELDPDAESYWSWNILGDIYTSMTPLTAEVAPVPDGVEFEPWTFINGYNASEVEVGFLDGKCYMRGFADNYGGIADTAIIGDVADGRITFPSGQYLGVIPEYLTVAYFVSGTVTEVEDEEYGAYEVIEPNDALVFEYSESEKMMKAKDGFCISSVPDQALYYELFSNIVIRVPDPDAEISTLLTPVLYGYIEAMPEYDIPDNLMFYLPMVDADYNVLDTEKYFWNVLFDDDVYTFAADEYPGLAAMFGEDFEMTDVPFGFNDKCDFYGMDTLQDFYFYVEGFDTMAVRGVYKDGDKVIYSPLLYVIGEPSGVKSAESGSEIVSSVWFDLQGRKLTRPANGIYIRADKKADGTVSYSKVAVK